MRYGRIFLLHFQDVFHSRGRSFVWFLVGFLGPLLLLLYWRGLLAEQPTAISWSLDSITSYYLLVSIATALLVVHIDEDVAFRDIKEGVLAKYLLRPFSYLSMKFMEELPWRILQGFFGIIVFIVFLYGLQIPLPLVSGMDRIAATCLIFILGLCVSFLLKMVLALTAFWTTDYWGILSLEELTFLVFGGIAMPLILYPSGLEQIAYLLPFAYIIYFPVMALEGMLETGEMVGIIGTQGIFILMLYGVFRIIWAKGLRKFTATGQ